MAIDIFNFDGTKLTTVQDGTLKTDAASISLVGRGFKGWGKPLQENILWIMQNFAGIDPPSNPLTGQLWYDTNSGSNIIKVWNGTKWISGGGVITQGSPPAGAPGVGSMWYDDLNMQLYAWNGTSWDLVGPLGSKTNNNPRNPAPPTNSAIEAIRLQNNTGAFNNVWRITIEGQTFAILSKDPEFFPLVPIPGFSSIKTGINFDNRLSNLGVSNAEIIENTLPNIDAAWNIGSPNKRLANIFTANLQVQGTANFDNRQSLTEPPIRIVPQNTLTSPPRLGAVEFDGNSFYFTGLIGGSAVRQTPIFEQDLTTSNRLYVSTNGNDTNDGTTPAKSMRTLKNALGFLVENNKSGYTIFVEGGEYYEQNPLYVPPNTSIVGDNLRRTSIWPIHDELDIFHVDVGTYFYGMTFKGHRYPAFAFAFPCSTANAVVSGGSISSIRPLYSQTGYVPLNPPAVFIEPPPNGGVQAQATAIVVNGAIADIIVTNQGNSTGTTPYSPLTSVVVTGGTPTIPAVLRPRIVDGYIVAIDIVNPGSGYEDPVGVSISDSGGGTGATATAVIGNGVIQRYQITNPGSGYTRTPHVSVKPRNPPFITSSPYVQNCSSITGPFDVNGKMIVNVPLPYDNSTLATYGYANLDPDGAGAGIRIDGEVLDNGTVIRSFVADSFTQINQGGIGHLIINRGYAQFVSCFTTFSSIGYWARSGGFANISNSVIDFGDVGLQAEGYYPTPYSNGILPVAYTSQVGSVTMIASGSGYTAPEFPVSFIGGLGPGGVTAQGNAIVDSVSLEIISVRIDDPGSGYVDVPTIDFSAGGGIGANGTVNLLSNSNVLVQGFTLPNKPTNSSAMLLDGEFYTVQSAVQFNSTTWNVNIYPPLVAGAASSSVTFHDISNLSTGGLALEYVGSGVTYNALPVYGGVPDTSKQVVDRVSDPTLAPGRVYYVTIDNTGNFKIGEFFSVSFADGAVSITSDNFNLTGLSAIGPFKRGGFPVGTFANEISNDPQMTHPANPSYDNTTIPTQYATRGYIQQISTDVLPDSGGIRSLGSSSKAWKTLYADDLRATSATAFNLTVSNLLTTSGLVTTNMVANNSTMLNGTISNMGANNGQIQGDLSIGGNLTVLGNSFVVSATTYSVIDPLIDIGTAGPGNVLLSDDGFDRGLIMHYYDTTEPNPSIRYSHAYIGRSDALGTSAYDNLVYITNVNAGDASTISNVPIPGTAGATTRWGRVQVGSTIINGSLDVTGDITAFYTSDERLKKDLEVITNALDKVSAVSGYTFSWNDEAKSSSDKSDRREAGVIAQQIESIMPEAVVERSDGYKAVRYEQLIPVLIEAIKELRSEVEILKRR
jgi:hypothetical protein